MAALFISRNAAVNVDLLHEELTSVTGYEACSAHPTGITVYFSGNAHVSSLQAIVEAHDESELSTKEMQLENLRTEIDTLKGQVGNINNLTALEATSAIKLLYKVLRANELI